jgi:ATP-dependent helicase/nuclease subunit B
MKTLDQLAEEILARLDKKQAVHVILPSERAKRYLLNALYSQNNGPLLAPHIQTIDQWVTELSPKKILHPTRILLILFEVYQEVLGTEAQSFEEFLSWGPILISDFNDVDRYLVNEKQLYQNLASIKALESWQIDEQQYSLSQKKFMAFWEHISDIHSGLLKQLDIKNAFSKAMAYRFIAENPTMVFSEDVFFIFAGFNALSTAEQSIIQFLLKRQQADFFIDADVYYFENKHHEAGAFQRKNLTHFGLPEAKFLRNHLGQETFQVKVVECAQHIGQVKVLATELKKLKPKDWSEVLVLLADESLVHAALRHIPKNVGNANITLGLPLDQTPIRTWVDLCFQIQENKQKFKTSALYYKDFQRFCHHAFTSICLDKEAIQALNFAEKQTVKYNRVFQNIGQLKLSGYSQQLIELLCVDWQQNWSLAIAQLRKMNAHLLEVIPKANDFEQTAILTYEQSCRQFETLLAEGFPTMTLGSFKKLFYQHWTKAHLAYLGNPTNGLQITGLLETRLLDFEHVYVLGMNEGKLPPTNPIQSIIPMDLRAAFGLPSNRDKQGIFAQHFYRLLHHARELTFTYTTASEILGSSERSRYLLQLEMEWLQSNPNIKWEEYKYQIPASEKNTDYTEIVKTQAIIERIEQYLANGVSASALKKYLACPLDFYYRYVVEFGEEDEVEEDLATHTFGSLIHNCLEELYLPYAQRDKNGILVSPLPGPITEKEVAKMLTQYPEALRKQFMNYFDQNEQLFSRGKNRLSYEMALDLTKEVLLKELNHLQTLQEPLYIEQLEARFELILNFQIGQKDIPMKFVGYVDRIDRVGNHYRVIDYKSGKVDAKEVKMSTMNDSLSNLSVPKHTLQLSLYCLFFKEKYGHLPQEAIIESLINRENHFALNIDQSSMLSAVPEILYDGLTTLVTELLDQSVSFTHYPTSKYCQFCS